MELFAPTLCTFTFNGSLDPKIRGNGLSSVKQVKIDASQFFASEEHALNLLSWLPSPGNIESLTVTSPTL